MYRLTIVIICCFLTGCKSNVQENPKDFKSQQEQLFYETDHKLIYEACQELMRSYREGKLSRTTFYFDDAEAVRNELPESINSMRPTYVRVYEIMVEIKFHSEDGVQLLRCFSSEFGEPKEREGNKKGLGFRSNPYQMDTLFGNESLDYLNDNYEHFEMELIPGLKYEKYPAEQAVKREEIRQSNERMDLIMEMMEKTIEELAMKKQRLLYQTDHHELLTACRKIIAIYRDGQFSRSKINIADTQAAGDLERVPRIILDLEPVYIWFEDNRVIVALIGGMDHAGVQAYVNDDEAVTSDDSLRLIEGLLYYDDGLREAGADYKDYLESLENEAITYLDWKRKQKNLPIPERSNNER